jgi:hypothetical protein
VTRREWLYLAAPTALLAQARPEAEERIARIVRDYDQQGIHRTATKVDRAAADWLAEEVRKCGLKPSLESFSIARIDPVDAVLSAASRKIEGVPLFDCGFTEGAGVTGRLGPLGSDAPVGLTEIVPNTAGAGPLGEARRKNLHRAIVAITHGGRPGLCPSNAESFLHPIGPPVLQVSSTETEFLKGLADQGAEVTVVAQVKRTTADAMNVLASIPGADRSLPPLVIMTPRSGWWTCASERGGGIACWLELMRSMHGSKPARDVQFVASSGHELGQLGIETYADRRPDLIKHACAWMHFGANIGAAQGAGNGIQASDDEMESILAEQLTAGGLKIDRRVPRGTIPGGEAGVVHRGGGRYLSVIGQNALFHNPADRGPDAIDTKAIASFAVAFTAVANKLAT